MQLFFYLCSKFRNIAVTICLSEQKLWHIRRGYFLENFAKKTARISPVCRFPPSRAFAHTFSHRTGTPAQSARRPGVIGGKSPAGPPSAFPVAALFSPLCPAAGPRTTAVLSPPPEDERSARSSTKARGSAQMPLSAPSNALPSGLLPNAAPAGQPPGFTSPRAPPDRTCFPPDAAAPAATAPGGQRPPAGRPPPPGRRRNPPPAAARAARCPSRPPRPPRG